ncbi:MAG TPA: carboxypeptidase regulatory-like domain-containing protein [Pyrinomonadaceae bacterium]
MSKRSTVRLTLAFVVLAVSVAALGAGARASRGSLPAAPAAQGTPQTFVLTDFGAVGDGVADDGPALQAALDALAAAGGGTLQVPAGRYAIATPVTKNFGGLASPVIISGVPSTTEPAPPTAGGQELTRGLDLTSEFLPRTGEAAAAITISGLKSLTVRELAFVGEPNVTDDALVTLLFADVGEAVVRHCEFYGLASMNGAIILAHRSALKVERSVFLGCITNSGTYSSVVQNIEWKGISFSDTIFADYGQRPDLFGKTGLAAPFAWVNIGNAAPADNESPRREASFTRVFFDEGGLSAIASTPDFFEPPSAPIDLFYVSMLRMNVSNLNTSGLYLTELRGVLVEDGRFGLATRTETAVNLVHAGSAIISRIACADAVSTVRADAATGRLVVIDAACPVIDSQAPYTRVFQAATADDDPARYVASRFQTALGRAPDPAAHFYWADRILRCDAAAACVTNVRAALGAYLATSPQPTFTLGGRATDEVGAPVENALVTLSGSQTVETFTDADGRYHFSNLPTSGIYTVAAEKRNYTFATPPQTVTTPAGARTVDFNATAKRNQIGGRLADGAARAVAGATVTLSGTRSVTTTTDANGYYTFAGLPAGGAYTVTPSSARYSFAPASQTVADLEADEFIAFSATPLFYTINGQVLAASGVAMSGVSVSLGGSKTATASTNSQGVFTFFDVPRGGNYTVTPGPTVGYTFGPASRSFTNLNADQGGVYTGTPTSYRLTGRVTSGGAALSGVAINVTGAQAATATTDAGGNYTLTLPAHGSYTVTPSRQHYTFAPASTTVNPLSSDRAADFTATLNRHKISGRVARSNGQAMAGVAVALSGSQTGTTTTDANGDYSFANLPAGGNYTVTPSKAGYAFNPATRTFNDLGADQTAPFVVTPASFNITGRVASGAAGLSGVTVTLSGARSATTTTDASGNYSLAVTSEGAYTVTPSKANYTFAPASQTFNDPLSNKTADFAATLNRHKISGRVARSNGQAMAGVTVTLSGAQAATATTDAGGNYSFTNLAAGSDYTVTPSRAGYDFAPKSKSFVALGADQTADFAVTPGTFAIGGRVTSAGAGVAGVAVTLSGSKTGTATTDANGAYSFSVSSEGTYTVTPSKVNYTFTPASQSFTNPTADRAADFTVAVNRHTISGRVTKSGGVGLAGATVTLSGTQTGTTTTDANGNYSLANLAAGGNYTVTPSKANYTFAPAPQTFNDLGANRTADFTATPQNLTVAGRVTVSGGAGLSGVTVTLSGARNAATTTDANGAYSFSVPADADYTVTPSKKSYNFTPASAAFKALDANKTADFAAALNRHAVRGRVTDANNYPLGGVAVALSGSKTGTATTDANGDFSFPNLDEGGTYAVTPSAPMLAFTPASQTFADLAADAYAGFVGNLARYKITGRVTEKGAALGGVTVTMAGTHPALGPVGAVVTTGADGSYSLEALAGGDYAVTPSKKNYSFGPVQATFRALSSDRAADFAATPLPTFRFDAASYSVPEDGGIFTATVLRVGDASAEVTVVYQALGDTARRGADFLASIGQLTFAPGETSKTFSIFITDDSFVEDQESFKLTLEPGEGASAGGEVATARVTITDNDASPAIGNPIDDDEFFVRQHYRDFFSREPDASGLAFWTGEIKKCGSDAACREARRVSVSAAFFLSIEFQETGYLVYRLYKTAYARAPERVEEFMLDARVMGEGVVVGRAGWQQVLDANKASSARAFVGRAEFEEHYPTRLTPAQFVDSLFQNAGVAPTAAERQAAIDDFAGAPNTSDADARAVALRRVAESPALARAETSRAFVLMQYFGYLRRNPDEAPNTDMSGYNHWLGKLLEFGGDYERAEMVKAFLSSTEYRGRFGN